MRLLFAALAFVLVLTWESANAQSLAGFSSESVHIQMGTNALTKVYVNNPDPAFANITVWLGGNYPATLAKFSSYPGVYFTSDMRNATIGLNPNEQRVLDLIIYSTVTGTYVINVTANTTASGKKDFDSIRVLIDYPPGFPGLEPWGIFVLVVSAGAVFWMRKRD